MSEQTSAFSPLHKKVEATRAVLAEAIEGALQNTARMEDIEAQSQQLELSANKFRSESGSLQRKMFWHNVKMKVALGLVGVCVLGAIVGVLYALAK